MEYVGAKKSLIFYLEVVNGVYCKKNALVPRDLGFGFEMLICGYGEETKDHLVAECVLVKALWWHLCVWTKIRIMTQVSSFSDLVGYIQKLKGSIKWKNVLETMVYGAVWRIWKARNDRVFEGIPFSVLQVVDAIKEVTFI
ncbi:uncharacterized protein LOC110892761 [Helianthus annuus]|uniref:uncharacterized protein LOC110892761 n=1 Tax=Helianthus annuus TaxID=4232 RepID=UPI000B8F205E|nr:uncharacterized protein LOC110892761 [Helianthus annuus]